MESETHWVGERLKLYQLMQAHPDWSLRTYARALGHDPKWVQRWKARLQSAPSPLTLDAFKSRSHAPKTPPRRVHPNLKPHVLELRQTLSEQFHRRAGAKTILYALQQRHAQQPFAVPLPPAPSTITNRLHELGCIPPRPAPHHEPLDLPAPMEEWEMDFGEAWLGEEEQLEFFIVVDGGTSRLVYLEGSRGYNAETALEAVARLFAEQGLAKRLRFDRDTRLWGAWTRDSYPAPLIRFRRVLGGEPVVCPPHRPDKKPFVERCIATLKHEWLDRVALPTVGAALDALAQFPTYYNDQRPHQGRACQNRPPSVAFPSLPPLPTLPQTVAPDAWLHAIHTRIYRRRVTSDGTIQVDRYTDRIGTAYAKQQVVVHVDAKQRCLHVTHEGRVLHSPPLQGLHGETMDFEVYLVVMRSQARTIAAHRRLLWERTGETA